jgi:uncharacterized coiled-coil DUF342 family protein
MDEETRAAFGRMDRWFELSQSQHNELRAEMREEIGGLRAEIGGLRAEIQTFREWVTTELAELRRQIREILTRLERLERRQGDPVG